jgi:hypothetical protein
MPIIRRIGNLMHRARVDREIDAEFESHIAMRIDENVSVGVRVRDSGWARGKHHSHAGSTQRMTAGAEGALWPYFAA